MAEEIKIIITADGAEQVTKGLNATSDALKKTAAEASKTGQALNSTLKPGAAQAGQSLTNLSRIAQDAPFGFIGIQNNISPLIESFGRLKAETGTTGGALKALVQGLAGPAGLGLAVGVGTALLTAFGDELFSTSKESDVLDQSIVQLGLDISNVNEDFKSFAKNLDNAQKTNAFNITARFGSEFEGQFLAAQANFVTTSEKLVKVQDNLTKARALYNQVVDQTPLEPTEEQAKLLEDARKAMFELINQEKDLYDQREQIAAQNRSIRAEEDRRLAAEKKANAQRLKNVETIDSVIAKLRRNIADQDILGSILGTPRVETIQKDFKLVEGAITKLVEKFNLTTDDRRLLRLQIQIENLQSILKPAELVKVTKKTAKELEQSLSTGLRGLKVQPIIEVNTPIENIKGLEDITNSIETYLVSSISGIGELFGQTLANVLTGTATFGDFFTGLFDVLGGAVEQLGKELIQIGTLAIVAKLALDQVLLNPFAAIAAGVALVALGSLIQQTTNRQRFAVGTRNAPGGLALVGERGPELVNLPGGSQVIPAAQTSQMMGGMAGSVEVFGVLRGQDIFFSNKKYGQTYGRTT